MRRVLVICLGYLCTCTRAVVSYAHTVLSKDAYSDPPPLTTFNDLRRRDLLAGDMPAQATPTQQAVRPRADQRPWLNRFLVPRNTTAFA